MSTTLLKKTSRRVALVLAALLPLACDNPFGGSDAPDTPAGFAADTATWPRPFYIGATYALQLRNEPLHGDWSCVTVTPADSGVRLAEVQFFRLGLAVTPGVSLLGEDSLRVSADCKGFKGRLAYPLRVEWATGFAPLESSAIRAYDKTFFSACMGSVGAFDSTRIVLKPLGATSEGFRFERAEHGVHGTVTAGTNAWVRTVTDTIHDVDTLLFKRSGNAVLQRVGGQWTVPEASSLFFLQDTISTNVEPTGRGDSVLAYLGSVPPRSTLEGWWASYAPGEGLIEYRANPRPANGGCNGGTTTVRRVF